MARGESRVKKHLIAAIVALAVIGVEAHAFTELIDWANSASLDVGDPAFLLSVTAILLAPLIGIAIVWYLEKT